MIEIQKDNVNQIFKNKKVSVSKRRIKIAKKRSNKKYLNLAKTLKMTQSWKIMKIVNPKETVTWNLW